jgi:hypothetical protein
MRLLLAERGLVAGVMLSLVLGALNGDVTAADLDGPVEVHLSGVDPAEGKFYYSLISRAGSQPKSQMWYFDLDGKEPTTPIRALSIENEMEESRTGTRFDEDRAHDVWMKVARRLNSPRILVNFDLRLSQKADSVGVDIVGGERTLYESHLVVETAGRTRILDLEMSCDPLIAVEGVYGIPGRPELIVVVSYKARGPGCQEFELPILIPTK